jgi:hypothetical protein
MLGKRELQLESSMIGSDGDDVGHANLRQWVKHSL